MGMTLPPITPLSHVSLPVSSGGKFLHIPRLWELYCTPKLQKRDEEMSFTSQVLHQRKVSLSYFSNLLGKSLLRACSHVGTACSHLAGLGCFHLIFPF